MYYHTISLQNNTCITNFIINNKIIKYNKYIYLNNKQNIKIEFFNPTYYNFLIKIKANNKTNSYFQNIRIQSKEKISLENDKIKELLYSIKKNKILLEISFYLESIASNNFWNTNNNYTIPFYYFHNENSYSYNKKYNYTTTLLKIPLKFYISKTNYYISNHYKKLLKLYSFLKNKEYHINDNYKNENNKNEIITYNTQYELNSIIFTIYKKKITFLLKSLKKIFFSQIFLLYL